MMNSEKGPRLNIFCCLHLLLFFLHGFIGLAALLGNSAAPEYFCAHGFHVQIDEQAGICEGHNEKRDEKVD